MERQDYYRRLIADHEKSGKSVREFCRAQNLSPWTFYSWRKKLASADDPPVENHGTVPAHSFLRVAVDGGIPSGRPWATLKLNLIVEPSFAFQILWIVRV